MDTPGTDEDRRPEESSGSRTAPGASQLRSILEKVAVVVGPATFLTWLMAYFGRAYTDARHSYFGLEPSVVGLSTQEYLLRSIRPVFVPLGVVALIGLVLIWTHSAISRWIRTNPSHRALIVLSLGIGLGGLMLVAVGLSGFFGYPVFGIHFVITPTSFALGTIGLSYAVSLRGRAPSVRSSKARWRSSANRVLVSILIILNIFWAMGEAAASLGRQGARMLTRQLASRAPGVILYSKQALSIDPRTGVTMERIEEEGSPYKVRYQRLNLLLRSGGKYFLLPVDWSPPASVVIVLPDSDVFRIEFTPR